MTAVFRALGGSKTTLWSYFPSKEKLFAAVLEDQISAYQEQLQQLLDRSDDLSTAVVAFCRGFIAKVLSPDVIDLYRLVVAEGARFPEIGKIFQERAIQPTQATIAHFLARHISEGTLRVTDPLNAARVLTSLCTGKQHEVLVGGEMLTPTQMDAETAFLADVFLRAFEVH